IGYLVPYNAAAQNVASISGNSLTDPTTGAVSWSTFGAFNTLPNVAPSTGPTGHVNPLAWVVITPPVTVPYVVGLTQATASNKLTASGLQVGTVAVQNSATVPFGDVISQAPLAGSIVPSGSAVGITVSSLPFTQTVTVPNLIGLPASQSSTLD